MKQQKKLKQQPEEQDKQQEPEVEETPKPKEKKPKEVKEKKPQPDSLKKWNEHLKQFRSENPTLSYKDCQLKAKESFKKPESK